MQPGQKTNDVYDAESNTPDAMPNLKAMEEGRKHSGQLKTKYSFDNINRSTDESLDSLKRAESGSSSKGDKVGIGFNPILDQNTNLSLPQKVLSTASEHRKAILIGGGATG